MKKAISRCVEVFGERNVYPAHIIEEMKTALGKFIDSLKAVSLQVFSLICSLSLIQVHDFSISMVLVLSKYLKSFWEYMPFLILKFRAFYFLTH